MCASARTIICAFECGEKEGEREGEREREREGERERGRGGERERERGNTSILPLVDL